MLTQTFALRKAIVKWSHVSCRAAHSWTGRSTMAFTIDAGLWHSRRILGNITAVDAAIKAKAKWQAKPNPARDLSPRFVDEGSLCHRASKGLELLAGRCDNYLVNDVRGIPGTTLTMDSGSGRSGRCCCRCRCSCRRQITRHDNRRMGFVERERPADLIRKGGRRRITDLV